MNTFELIEKNLKGICLYPKIEIPSYQRDYDWTAIQWEELWQDLAQNLDTDDDYFIGPINGEVRRDGYGIILADGQQRITTLLLMLVALRHELRDKESEIDDLVFTFPEEHRGQRDLYEPRLQDKTPVGVAALRVALLSQGPIPDQEASGRHAQALNFFIAKISLLGPEGAADLYAMLVRRLKFALVLAQETGAGVKMFERSNTRGRPLTFTDKLKSILIGLSSSDDTSTVVENWTASVEKLRRWGKYSDQTFIAWLSAEYHNEPRSIREKEALSIAKKVIQLRSSLVVSGTLLDYCSAVAEIAQGQIPASSQPIGSLGNILCFKKFSQLQRLLPAARHLTDEQFTEFAAQVENTICTVSIARVHPPDIERRIQPILLLLRQSALDLDGAQSALRKIRDDASERFGDVMINKTFGDIQKPYLLILWGLMEQHFSAAASTESRKQPRAVVIQSRMSVEHILPQSAGEDAREAIEEYGSEFAPDDRQRIGNLTPLEDAYNATANPYSKKGAKFASSGFYLTKTMSPDFDPTHFEKFRKLRSKFLPSFPEWNHEALEQRSENLYKLAAAVLDFTPRAIARNLSTRPTFEDITSLPRQSNFSQLLAGLQQISDGDAPQLRIVSTLRFLDLVEEDEAEEDAVSQEGAELLKIEDQDQKIVKMEEHARTHPFVLAWAGVPEDDRETVLAVDLGELTGKYQPTVLKQVLVCLNAWVAPPAPMGDAAEKKPYFGVTLQDLISEGLLAPGDPLVSVVPKWPADATISPDGRIEYGGVLYDSPSSAGSAARQRAEGTNGWEFWALVKSGAQIPLDQIRQEFLDSHPAIVE
jgi:hypothetical protein